MIALDTNILVYAHDARSPFQKKAQRILREFCEGSTPWALAWPCVYEFARIITHPKVFAPPTLPSEAADLVDAVLSAPTVTLLTETARHQQIFTGLMRQHRFAGNIIHDAHIAALLIEHGVREIFTADTDFHRFPQLVVTNPFQ